MSQKTHINLLEDELEKLGYVIYENEKGTRYLDIETMFMVQRNRMFWEAIELLQGYGDNQIMENFAEYLHDNKLVQKNE